MISINVSICMIRCMMSSSCETDTSWASALLSASAGSSPCGIMRHGLPKQTPPLACCLHSLLLIEALFPNCS